MSTSRILGTLAITLFVTACGSAKDQTTSTLQERWDDKNAPGLFDVRIAKFDTLATEGMLDDANYPWSDDYWGTYSGGIAKRWQVQTQSHGNYRTYMYDKLTADDVQAFIAKTRNLPVAVAKLSPAEKYDLLMGRYDFQLTHEEHQRTLGSVDASGDVPHWFGLCHGWAPATLEEREPGHVAKMTNRDGIEIPFYTSDINALMTKVYADYLESTRFLGRRCNTSDNSIRRDRTGRILASECRDTNPGTLHLVLGQLLGNPDTSARKGFVADVTMGAEVWNQAVSGYKVVSKKIVAFDRRRDPRASFRAPGTVKLANIKTELYYIGEIGPHAEPAKSMKDRYTQTLELEYTLELDASGTIIGGEWTSDDRPDFLWMPTAKPETAGQYLDYAKIVEIRDASLTREN